MHESKITDVYGCTCTNVSIGEKAICRITCAYNKYRMHVPEWALIEIGMTHVDTDVVWNV